MIRFQARNFLFFALILIFTDRFAHGKQSSVLPTKIQETLTTHGEDFLRLLYTTDFHSILKSTLKAIAEDHNGTSHVFTNVTNDECIEHVSYIAMKLESISTSVEPLDVFILHMVDSWGKPPSGILSGNLASPGDFQECIQAEGNGPNTEIKGSYCSTYLIPKLNSTDSGIMHAIHRALSLEELLELMADQTSGFPLVPSIGTCFPASCSTTDVQQLWNNLLRKTGLEELVDVSVLPCRQDNQVNLDNADYFMIGLLSAIVGICTISTVVDVAAKSSAKLSKNGFLRFLNCFSWYSNTKRWANTDTGRDNLGCLHGLRFLSMAWVVLGHSWMVYLLQNTWNSTDLLQMYKENWTILAVLNGTVSVDTFFLLSGTLVAYNVLKELDNSKKLNVPMLYLHRYLRLTPTYAIAIGIYATLYPYVGNGPRWTSIEAESEACRRNWWHNLLYITTVYVPNPNGTQCIGSAWYLSNDMIYFIVSPIFIYALWRWRNVGIGLLLAWIIQSTVHTGLLLSADELPPTLNYFLPAKNFSKDVYHPPWTRSAPYAVGLLLGYILHLRRQNPRDAIRLSRIVVLIAWIASTGIAMAVVFGPYNLFDPANAEEIYGGTSAIVYGSLHRLGWAISISWIIFACTHGYGGIVNELLSWKPFVPLGRLTYCVYITSVQVERVYANVHYQPVRYSVYGAVYFFLANLTFSLFIGFILSVTIEVPFLRLEKQLLVPSNVNLDEVFIARERVKNLIRPTTIWTYKFDVS